MKQNFLKWMVCMCFGLLSVATVTAGGNYKTVKVKAPFPMQPIKVFIYPDRDLKITDFGAVPGGEVDNTKAIAAAIDACNKAEKLIKEEKYEEAIEPVDYLLKEMELTEEEKIQMKMTRTALCFSAGRFDEAMEGCTELINLDRSEEGYYYFMFLLHHRLILQ